MRNSNLAKAVVGLTRAIRDISKIHQDILVELEEINDNTMAEVIESKSEVWAELHEADHEVIAQIVPPEHQKFGGGTQSAADALFEQLEIRNKCREDRQTNLLVKADFGAKAVYTDEKPADQSREGIWLRHRQAQLANYALSLLWQRMLPGSRRDEVEALKTAVSKFAGSQINHEMVHTVPISGGLDFRQMQIVYCSLNTLSTVLREGKTKDDVIQIMQSLGPHIHPYEFYDEYCENLDEELS